MIVQHIKISVCGSLEKLQNFISLVKQFFSVVFTQEFHLEHGVQDGYVLQLVLLSIFLAVTLILVSVLLIACRCCCEGDWTYARWDKSLSYVQMQTCYWWINSRIIHFIDQCKRNFSASNELLFYFKIITNDNDIFSRRGCLALTSDSQTDWEIGSLTVSLTNSLAHCLIS